MNKNIIYNKNFIPINFGGIDSVVDHNFLNRVNIHSKKIIGDSFFIAGLSSDGSIYNFSINKEIYSSFIEDQREQKIENIIGYQTYEFERIKE